jgi:hypothetical protein
MYSEKGEAVLAVQKSSNMIDEEGLPPPRRSRINKRTARRSSLLAV